MMYHNVYFTVWMVFRGGVVNNDIFCQLIYILAKIHIHVESLYCHAISAIYFHNHLKVFTQLISHMGRHAFNGQKLYTTLHSNQEWCSINKHQIFHESYKPM